MTSWTNVPVQGRDVGRTVTVNRAPVGLPDLTGVIYSVSENSFVVRHQGHRGVLTVCPLTALHTFALEADAEEFTDAPPALPGLGFPDLDDRQLLDLCETLDNPHIRWCVRVLAHNRSTPLIRDACRRDLRAALGIREPAIKIPAYVQVTIDRDRTGAL